MKAAAVILLLAVTAAGEPAPTKTKVQQAPCRFKVDCQSVDLDTLRASGCAAFVVGKDGGDCSLDSETIRAIEAIPLGAAHGVLDPKDFVPPKPTPIPTNTCRPGPHVKNSSRASLGAPTPSNGKPRR